MPFDKWTLLPSLLIPIFVVLTVLRPIGSQFCATNGNETQPQDNPFFFCNNDSFSKISTPPIRNYTSGNFPIHYCNIVILLDLDKKFTPREDYPMIFYFMKDLVKSCMQRGIGYRTYIYPMFNPTEQIACCSESDCDQQIENNLDYDTFVGDYSNSDPIQNETSNFNFTYTLIKELKTYTTAQTKCLYNTVVLLTNRLFYITIDSSTIHGEMESIYEFGCITFTVVAVGRPEITYDSMQDAYANLTLNLYSVGHYNCLDEMKDCIKPCGPRTTHECQDVQNLTYSTCPAPTTMTPESSTMTPTSGPITDDPTLYDTWHIIYLFALSNRTTKDQFDNVIKYIGNPLQECAHVSARFLSRNGSDTLWITDMSSIFDTLNQLQLEDIAVPSDARFWEVYDNYTLDLVNRALAIPINQSKHDKNILHDPRIALLTDYVSITFIEAYNNQSYGLWSKLQDYEFEIYAFNNETAFQYGNKTAMKDRSIHENDNFTDTNEVQLCYVDSSVETIMYIIVGTCGGFMVLLFLATIIYRQKYMFAQKFAQFTRSHEVDDLEEAGNEEDMIDYWEVSEEKLTIKTERLGHGAYGQVYKGKIRDVPPAIEKYHRSEVAQYTDCDCAVKMLPRYANEQAKAEFMHEIELMKTLGFHEHIVNMLGCITTTPNKCCLLMEYCSEKDLLRYLKLKKVELEMTKSIDDQIEMTKEFLNFAWQVSQGMIWLQGKNVIHRDLAARNILISGYEGMRTAKISDFGLAILANSSQTPMSCAGRLPIKWLALESLEREEFSFQSDVWSFGIVLFEMYSMGNIPFADVEPTELISHLRAGNRPKRPLLAVDKVAETMQQCWEKDSKLRPNFEQLRSVFATLLDQATEGYGYLALIKTTDYRLVSEVNHNHHQNEEQPHDRSQTCSRIEIDGQEYVHTHTTKPLATRKRSNSAIVTKRDSGNETIASDHDTIEPLQTNTFASTLFGKKRNNKGKRSSEGSIDLGEDFIKFNQRRKERRATHIFTNGITTGLNKGLKKVNPFTHLKNRAPTTNNGHKDSRRGSVPY